MEIIPTLFKDVLLFRNQVFKDERGSFSEHFNQSQSKFFSQKEIHFCQDNITHSKKGVLRGLHYQLPPFAQSKLVSVIEGSVLDVVVDIRRGSPTFGQYFSQELNTENRFQMFIPRGFAHGFITLSKSSIFCYKVDNFFNSKYERSLSPDDPELDINWRLSKDEWIQSRRDKNNSKLANLSLFDFNQDLYA